MAYDTNTARRDAAVRTQTAVSTGIPFWDMMLSLGQASSQALTSYAPQAGSGVRAERGAVRAAESSVEVIPVGEETLNVGTRSVQGETTRVRRVVVETPVQQEVSLREERVIVERRKPTGASAAAVQGLLSETTVEMSDSFEVVEVWKSVRVTEEVVLRREVTERRETVRDTVRRDEVVVEQARPSLPAPRRAVEAAQPERKAAVQPQAKQPEPPKATAEPSKPAAEQNDKGALGRKA